MTNIVTPESLVHIARNGSSKAVDTLGVPELGIESAVKETSLCLGIPEIL